VRWWTISPCLNKTARGSENIISKSHVKSSLTARIVDVSVSYLGQKVSFCFVLDSSVTYLVCSSIVNHLLLATASSICILHNLLLLLLLLLFVGLISNNTLLLGGFLAGPRCEPVIGVIAFASIGEFVLRHTKTK